MSFGPRFINLLDDVVRNEGFPDISSALATLARDSRGPYVIYISRSARMSASVDLPANLSLMFGPGATVALGSGVMWVIRGETDLGAELRFVVDQRPTDDGRSFVRPRVLLAGLLDAIRPEWFRASVRLAGEADGLRPGVATTEESDDRALEAAIHCALFRVDQGLPQVPIRLRGPYLLRRPMVIPARASGDECELLFEGRHPRGDGELAATFQRHPGSSTAHALWSVGAGVRVRVSHVAFDARGERELPPGSDLGAVVHSGFRDGTQFDRCTFLLDRSVGVWCSARGDAQRSSADQGVPERISFTGCWFQCDPVDARGVAVRLDEAGPARLRVDGCSFRGDAAAMIAAASGMVDVIACDFHNEPAGDLRGAGVDLLLGQDARVASKDQRSLGPLVLNLMHVQSRSVRHLQGSRVGARGDSVVSLSGLVSRRRSFSNERSVPVIRWQGALGDRFLLQGSDVTGPIVGPTNAQGAVTEALATRLR